MTNDSSSLLADDDVFDTLANHKSNIGDHNMAKIKNLEKTLAEHVKLNNISCTSMIVTLFGDCVSQHGGWIWLGSLINALAPLGFNERSVRTSVYRLMQSEWLSVNKIGRKSFYCFSDNARSHYERAARRLYVEEPSAWDGNWLLVMPVSVPEAKREDLKKSLQWQGFHQISQGVYAHPSSDRLSLDELLIELKLSRDVIVFSATVDDLYSEGVVKTMVSNQWDIDELHRQYQNFLDFYRTLKNKISLDELTPKQCFLLRTVVLHDYRRIQLKDHDLPEQLLPYGWVGYEAQDLLKRYYKKLAASSRHYIEEQLENAQGTMPKASASFFNRFGGLLN